MKQILLVEDDEIMRITVRDRLQREKWQVDVAINGHEALNRLDQKHYHLILSDIRMPGMGGMELLERARKHSPFSDMFLMTAYGSVEDAIACLRHGAADYILKPFEMDDLIIRINRIFEMQTVRARCASLEDRCSQEYQDMIGNSATIRNIFSLINQIGPTDSTVLISGESGTGKELAANALHRTSHRADKPYIRINCAAIPEGLLESEFFGHEKGAFTGAHAKKLGRFELADGGTLLLDEIGDLPLGLQAKLLRVIEEGEFERLGGTRTIRVDVRLLCSTAKDLKEEVRVGRFRQDLLYRLSVIPLHLPPLRERTEDIPLLVTHFLRGFGRKRGMDLTLSSEAMQSLVRYDFPGNVRELKNIIERVSVLSPGPEINCSDLPADLHALRTTANETASMPLLNVAMASAEKQCLINALAHCGGNRTKAAGQLGISRKNLWEKMKLHGIEL
ncbi:MAG: sigma-54 dependent transcriptional regulator [Desulfobulbus sp.]|jgi:two-component system response regulator AtoC|uniref:sigma-54-dependent transcriptional regulator n=1 Tax=Desulfobulbus sp. TaxID=895 RepID=UPI002843705C|nr:sigma-54 dependent transcriptional regulator [Desulfobulbus sp.]MDR2550401.1 sigma-54 dependent transcriptional regulator [Desulfobulbus sp.]